MAQEKKVAPDDDFLAKNRLEALEADYPALNTFPSK
jgi:hypothetical protein